MKHLILADPWGFPERPNEIAAPLWVRAIAKVYGNVNPLWILRAGTNKQHEISVKKFNSIGIKLFLIHTTRDKNNKMNNEKMYAKI